MKMQLKKEHLYEASWPHEFERKFPPCNGKYYFNMDFTENVPIGPRYLYTHEVKPAQNYIYEVDNL